MAEDTALDRRGGDAAEINSTEDRAVGDVQLAPNLGDAAILVAAAVVTADRTVGDVQRECRVGLVMAIDINPAAARVDRAELDALVIADRAVDDIQRAALVINAAAEVEATGVVAERAAGDGGGSNKPLPKRGAAAALGTVADELTVGDSQGV
ncbi:MAG: hypothetical protein LC802_23610 [Acidobacteria bacterium]|nr:hypothetical protein [Acidobacteriota bacterium]